MMVPNRRLGCGAFLLLHLLACSEQEPAREDFQSRGDAQLARGELNSAIASYRLAFHRDTLDPVILGRLAEVYRRKGNAQAAGQYLRRATSLLYQQGLSALHAGNDSLARAAFEHILRMVPNHSPALNRLGDLSVARGAADSAQMWYEKSLKANSHFAETHVKLGRLHLAHRDYAAARHAFETAIAVNVNALGGYLGLGEVALRQRRWTDAADAFDKALLVHPGQSTAQAGLQRARSHL